LILQFNTVEYQELCLLVAQILPFPQCTTCIWL